MKFYIYTLGCKVNTYESNVMKDILINNGFIEATDDEIADIYVVNTCTVTNTADNKSLKVIRQVRRKNESAIVVAVGCMIQYRSEDINLFNDVDILIGNINKTKIALYIKEFLNNKKQIIAVTKMDNASFENMQLNNFNKTRAFVKIQDGCNNFCSYCIIPYTRGDVRSKEKDVVLKEIEALVLSGHKEVVLTGIHTGNYGAEFNNYDFADLLNDIVKIKGLKRIRISSIEITELNDRVLEIIKNNHILVDHMHIPLQSGCDKILKLMNRKYDVKYFIDKINTIRSIRPNISITTDVIVGFPNETDEDFKETIETIKKIKFSKLHVFPYSKRNGTKAASMNNQVDENVKKERVHALLELSKKLELEYMQKFIGKEVTFIPEVIKNDYIIGHTGNYLLVKCMSNDLNKDEVSCIIEDINYPYCLGRKIR